MLVIMYKPSKLVLPELAYIKPVPSKMKQELNPPNKKYINPPVVDNSEFLYIVLNMYNRGQWNGYPALRTVRDSFPSYGSPSISSNDVREF